MPKTPILSRTVLFSRLRDKTIRFLHWNRVDTSLGTMWESRNLVPIDNSKTAQQDVYDASVDAINETNDAAFLGLHGGVQVPSDFNTQ